MNVLATFPSFRSVVLDTSDARGLAEFYRDLLGFRYRDGDERPPVGQPDPVGNDFVMLVDPSTGMRLAFQQVEGLQQSTWPLADVPQQLHLDLSVSDAVELATQRDRALSLGQHFWTIALMTHASCCTCSQIQPVIRFASSWSAHLDALVYGDMRVIRL